MKLLKKRKLDLLSIRRVENKSFKITNSYIISLRKKGFLVGGFILALSLLGCLYVSFETYSKIKYRKKLTIEETKYSMLKNKFNILKQDIRSIYSTNSKIAQGIIGVKSGSALLLEINRILPETIQLKSIVSNENELLLKGLAYQPKALDSINSLKVQISNSFLIENQSPFLIKASETKRKDINMLQFTIESRFKKQESNSLLVNYEKLGSYGLAKRVKLMKDEGLIK